MRARRPARALHADSGMLQDGSWRRVAVRLLPARKQKSEASMPYAESSGVKLYFEETGTGHPIIFVHEFGADYRQWETQVRWYSREYRCVTFNARGYPPSDVPDDDA